MLRLRTLACIAAAALAAGCGDDCTLCPQDGAVRGQVLDLDLEPVPGARVTVAGRTVRTTMSGTFLVPDVVPPYDAVVVPHGRVATLYTHLRRLDPVLLATVRSEGGNRSAVVRGSLPAPSSPGEEIRIAFAGRGLRVRAQGICSSPSPGSYALVARWSGPETILGTLTVLSWKSTAGIPRGDYALAQRQVALRDDAEIGAVDFEAADFARPATLRLAGAVHAPAGYRHATRHLHLHLGPTSINLAAQLDARSLGDAFEYVVPAVDGVRFSVADMALQAAVHGNRGSWLHAVRLQPGPTALQAWMPAGVRLLEPEHAHAGVDSASLFAWDPGDEGGVHAVRVTPRALGDPEFLVFATGTSMRLPAHRDLGLALPRGAAYTWQVTRVPDTRSVDAAAARRFLEDYARGFGTQAFSETIEFTTRR